MELCRISFHVFFTYFSCILQNKGKIHFYKGKGNSNAFILQGWGVLKFYILVNARATMYNFSYTTPNYYRPFGQIAARQENVVLEP